jgi:hypothetical protein
MQKQQVNSSEIDALLEKANLALQEGRIDDAKNLYHRVLNDIASKLVHTHFGIGVSLQCLGDIYFAEGDYKNSLQAYSRLLDFALAVLGVAHPQLVPILYRLASTYDRLDEHTNAESLYCEAEELAKKVLPEDDELKGKIHESHIEMMKRVSKITFEQKPKENLECKEISLDKNPLYLGTNFGVDISPSTADRNDSTYKAMKKRSTLLNDDSGSRWQKISAPHRKPTYSNEHAELFSTGLIRANRVGPFGTGKAFLEDSSSQKISRANAKASRTRRANPELVGVFRSILKMLRLLIVIAAIAALLNFLMSTNKLPNKVPKLQDLETVNKVVKKALERHEVPQLLPPRN